jgi:RHS repeat-associated protein
VTQPVAEVETGYLGGSIIRDVKRMTRVDVSYNAALVRRYTIAYEASLSSAGHSRVASVTECAGAGGTDCLAPTTFTYQNGTPGLAGESSTSALVPVAPITMDVNGDGRLDLVYSSSATSGAGTWMVMLANASGGYASPINTGVTNTNYQGAIPIDYNSDGQYDLLVPYSGGTWWVMLGSASGLGAPTNTGAPATGTGANAVATDVNGDGREDLVWADLYGYVGGDTIRYRLREAGGGFSSTVYTLVAAKPGDTMIESGLTVTRAGSGQMTDFNGDGRGDIAYRQTRRIWNVDTAKWLYIRSIEAVCSGAWSFSVGTPNGSSPPVILDINNDGLSDIVYFVQSTAIEYRFSTGTSFTGAGTAGSMANYTAAFMVLDWDGDGYEDMLSPHIPTSTWHLWRSTGEGLALPVSTGIPYAAGTYLPIVTDMNGDGLRDLGYAVSGVWKYRLHAGVMPDLLTNAVDGFGVTASFAYTPISRGSHTKLADAVFPAQDYAGSLHVVSTLTASNGIGGTYTNTFAYRGARLNLQGRGFEGFERRTVTDSRNGVSVEATFNRTFPYTGTLASVGTYQPGGTTISLSSNTWLAHTYGSDNETRQLPYVSAGSSSSYEVGGAYNGALITSTTRSHTVDANTGALTDATLTTTEAASGHGVNAGQSHTQRTWHSALFNDFVNWCFGRPATTQQIGSHTMYGGGAQTRTVNTSWDGPQCRPTQTIEQPGDPQWQVTTVLGYDNDASNPQPDFGNVTSVAVTGVGMATRTTAVNWGTTGQAPVSVTNPLSHVTGRGYDFALGVQTSATDPNGIQTSWAFDSFGRLTRENRPDGTYSTWTPSLCSGPCYGWDNSLYRIDQSNRDSAGTQIDWQASFHDPFDRVLDRAWLNRDGQQVNQRWSFDALGRLSSESTPARFGLGEGFYYTSFTHDLAHRTTSASRPVSDTDPTLQSTQVYFEGLTVRTVDALGKTTTRIANGVGQAVRLTDHDGYYLAHDFDAFGNPIRVQDSGAVTLQTGTYNIRGLRTASTNVDLGAWSYEYNALGEMTSTTDALSKITTATYDGLSRPLTRVMPEGTGSITSTFTWGTSAAARNIGQLQQQQISGTNITTYREIYTFDSLGRPSQTQYVEGSNNYYVNTGYSTLTGNLDTLTYPTSTSSYRLKLQYEYQHGALLRVKDFNAPTTVFWQANAASARGVVTDSTLGNGLRTVKSLDQVTGWVDYVQSGPGGGTSVQNLSYLWDRVGNLTQRQDNNQGLTENAYYDNLHRLLSSTVTGDSSLTMTYAPNGNVLTKTLTGTGAYSYNYAYHATKLHAVASLTGSASLAYSYDANGNLTNRAGTTLSWFASNLPKAITKNSQNSSTFQYAPHGQRWRHAYKTGNVTYTHIYVGRLLEKVTQGSAVDWKHYVHAEGQIVALYSRKSSGTNTLSYLLQDHLGSTDAITASSGAVTVKESFDAFGKRRGTAWSGSPTSGELSTINGLTRRGYTAHEMLDSTDLIHMNGRVYDPLVGRFASADPYIDAAFGTQAFNRFAYVGNKPLSFTDPSGFGGDGMPTAKPIDPYGFTGSRIPRDPSSPPQGFSYFGTPFGGREGSSGGGGSGGGDDGMPFHINHSTLTYVDSSSGWYWVARDQYDVYGSISAFSLGPIGTFDSPGPAAGLGEGSGGGGGNGGASSGAQGEAPVEVIVQAEKPQVLCSNITRRVVGGSLAGGAYGLIAGRGSLFTGGIGALGGGFAGWVTSNQTLTQSQLGLSLFAIGAAASLPSGGGRTGALAGGIGEVASTGVTDFRTVSTQYTAAAVLGAALEALSGGSPARGGAAGAAALLTLDFVHAAFDKMCGVSGQ